MATCESADYITQTKIGSKKIWRFARAAGARPEDRGQVWPPGGQKDLTVVVRFFFSSEDAEILTFFALLQLVGMHPCWAIFAKLQDGQRFEFPSDFKLLPEHCVR